MTRVAVTREDAENWFTETNEVAKMGDSAEEHFANLVQWAEGELQEKAAMDPKVEEFQAILKRYCCLHQCEYFSWLNRLIGQEREFLDALKS